MMDRRVRKEKRRQIGISTYRTLLVVVTAIALEVVAAAKLLSWRGNGRRGERERKESNEKTLAEHIDVWYN